MDVAQTLEALLFFKNEPLTRARLAAWLQVDLATVTAALVTLDERLQGRGIVLLQEGDRVQLGTHPEAGPLLETITREELSKDIGRAGLETLAIVCYHGPVTRTDIDYIRGVNSSFIIRHLLTRGLIEREPHPDDARRYLYRPTLELWQHLGLRSATELPEFDAIKAKLAAAAAPTDEPTA